MNEDTIFTLRFAEDFDKKRKKGFEAEIDCFRFNPKTMRILQVRVTNIWKRPTWMTAAWFSENKESFYNSIEADIDAKR